MVRKGTVTSLIFFLAACSLAGCSGEGAVSGEKEGGQSAGNNHSQKPKEPVTLTFYDPTAKAMPENFMEKFGHAIQAKFPHITVNYVSSPDTNPAAHMTGMIAANEPIDIIMTSDQNFHRLVSPLNLQFDITDLVKSQKYELSLLDPGAVKAVQSLSNGSGMYGLPVSMNNFALLYNRDLFDKFGRAYPKDGMTWDETYELAKTMTRQENGVQYRGFLTQTLNFAWTNQLSAGFVDPKTDKSVFVSDERWSRFTKNLLRFYEIPGNALAETTFGAVKNKFFVDQVAAMYAYFIPNIEEQVNWDVVKLPEFGDLRGVGPQTMVNVFYLSSISKHKEAAFEAISFITSDEFQTNMSKGGTALPVSSNSAVKDAFGKDAPFLQGKNVRAILNNQAAAPFPPSPHSRTAGATYERMMYKLGKGQMDVNTALRQVAEEADKAIEELKSGK